MATMMQERMTIHNPLASTVTLDDEFTPVPAHSVEGALCQLCARPLSSTDTFGVHDGCAETENMLSDSLF